MTRITKRTVTSRYRFSVPVYRWPILPARLSAVGAQLGAASSIPWMMIRLSTSCSETPFSVAITRVCIASLHQLKIRENPLAMFSDTLEAISAPSR